MASIEALKQFSLRLKNANIVHALGGSGLLFYLNLTEAVDDWDITTDASIESAKAAIADLDYEHVYANDLFNSNYLLKVKFQGSKFDLIGGFSIKTSDGFYRVPTLVTGYWEDVPVGSPGAWAKAYELMGRPEKSKLLLDYINAQFNK